MLTNYEYITVTLNCKTCLGSQIYACLLPNKERGTLFPSCSISDLSTCKCNLTAEQQNARDNMATYAASQIGERL